MTTAPLPPFPAGRPIPRFRRPRPLAVAATAAALVLGLGACSTSGDDAGPTPTKATTTTVAAGHEGHETTTVPETTTTIELEEEQPPIELDPVGVEDLSDAELDDAVDRVERVNLTLEDLPVGWVAEPAIEEVGSVVADCTESGVDTNVVARAASDRFSWVDEEGSLGLDTATGYLVDEQVAHTLMAELGSQGFADCATTRLLGAEGVTVEGAFSVVDQELDLADEAVGLQGDFTISDGTQSAQLSAIIVAIRTDQVVTLVAAIAIDRPGDEQLLYEVFDLVAERQQL